MLLLAWFTLFLSLSLTLVPLSWFLGSFIGMPTWLGWLLTGGWLTLTSGWLWRERATLKKVLKDTQAERMLSLIFVLASTVLLSNFTLRQQAPPALVLHGASAHDSLWHLSLMSELDRGLPPMNPILSGEPLRGYHYLNDLWWVKVHQVTQIPLIWLYLWIAPWTLGALFASSSLLLFRTVFSTRKLAYFGASLAVWGAGLAYVAPFFFPQATSHQSAFWLDQSVHYGINQQLLESLSLVNVVLWLMWLGWHHRNWQRWWWIVSILLGSLVGVKVYGVAVYLPVIGLAALWQALYKNQWWLLMSVGLATVIAGLVAGLSQSQLGFPFLWEPGWFLKTQFESTQHLHYTRWELERLVFMEAGNWPRLIIHWSWAMVVFVFGNFGVKALGWLVLPSLGVALLGARLLNLKHSSLTESARHWVPHLFIWFGLATMSLLFPSLLLQKGIIWNTIQFLHYAQIPVVLLLTWGIAQFRLHTHWQSALLVLLILFALPTSLQTFWNNVQPEAYVTYSAPTVEMFQRAKSVPADTTLLLHPIYAKEAEVAALSEHSVYWADQTILDILGVPAPERQQRIVDISLGKSNCVTGEMWASPSAELGVGLTLYQCPIAPEFLPRHSDPATDADEPATTPTVNQ